MTELIDRALGDLIRRARKGAGMTQVDLANAMGVGQGTISRWEKGLPIADEFPALLEGILKIDLSPYIQMREEGDKQEWLTVRSSVDLANYVVAVTRRITHDDDLRMALTLLVKNDWLNQELWLVMASKDDLIRELGQDVFSSVWPSVLASRWVEKVGPLEYSLRLRYPVPT